ncbi:hypothetical protein HNQ36_003946 [Afipia massiliensis]|uniref:Uncharacterized protein n=1 Tax=Afipia massiliensis TaxID=211460 RepID=A0A840NB79_9BRAD|nr:hypothetical protein [Afipia massiliensis]
MARSSTEKFAMRLFERLRLSFGFLPIKTQRDSTETGDLTDVTVATPYVPAAAEATCCGHCSGNAAGHIPELPTQTAGKFRGKFEPRD